MGCGHSNVDKGSHRIRTYVVRCAERRFDGTDKKAPVKVVVFDFDETLTLTTLMPKTLNFDKQAHREAYAGYNFETPFVAGDRVVKLKRMLQTLVKGEHCPHRLLAILTKNSKGMDAVLSLLKIAGLSECFDAIWVMPFRQYVFNGMYREGSEWTKYRQEMGEDRWWRVSHKADMLRLVAKDPVTWFPQILDPSSGEVKAEFEHLKELRMESILLVDDLRSNFSSHTGQKVLRYCKVARYDADYGKFGFIQDMGGIGAHSDTDYTTLIRFAEHPWRWQETMEVECHQWYMEPHQKHHPVNLVLFDFDETLTVATFMPKDPTCCTQIGWSPDAKGRGLYVSTLVGSSPQEWTTEDLVRYNFESPYVEWSRVEKLKSLLASLSSPSAASPTAKTPKGTAINSASPRTIGSTPHNGEERRRLAVVTKNKYGVIAILNLLLLADLADYFSAIWALEPAKDMPTGVYQQDGVWKTFETPIGNVHAHKADVVHHVADNPLLWFPQFSGTEAFGRGVLPNKLVPEGIVLVDDERFNFRSDETEHYKVLRYCKVPRYDDDYRDCGPLNCLGGIGAHAESDFETLRHFVEEPWTYPITEDDVPRESRRKETGEDSWDISQLEREFTLEDLPKIARERSFSSASSQPAPDSCSRPMIMSL